jgi:hypothetical protein
MFFALARVAGAGSLRSRALALCFPLAPSAAPALVGRGTDDNQRDRGYPGFARFRRKERAFARRGLDPIETAS